VTVKVKEFLDMKIATGSSIYYSEESIEFQSSFPLYSPECDNVVSTDIIALGLGES